MQGTPLERRNFIFFSCLLKYDLSIGLPLTKHPDKTFWSNVFINGLQLQQFKFERGHVEGSVLIVSTSCFLCVEIKRICGTSAHHRSDINVITNKSIQK